jgi:hypothetical protein
LCDALPKVAAKSRSKIANVNEPFISAGHAPVFARSHQRISRGQEIKKKTFFFFAFCKKNSICYFVL